MKMNSLSISGKNEGYSFSKNIGRPTKKSVNNVNMTFNQDFQDIFMLKGLNITYLVYIVAI